jgi:hypothetical protein
MAKKPTSLTFRDIVLGAEADVIRAALDARIKIDALLTERQAAYEKIATLETQINTVVGEAGVYPFPAPPLPVAGFDQKPAKKSANATSADTDEDDESETDDVPAKS